MGLNKFSDQKFPVVDSLASIGLDDLKNSRTHISNFKFLSDCPGFLIVLIYTKCSIDPNINILFSFFSGKIFLSMSRSKISTNTLKKFERNFDNQMNLGIGKLNYVSIRFGINCWVLDSTL